MIPVSVARARLRASLRDGVTLASTSRGLPPPDEAMLAVRRRARRDARLDPMQAIRQE